MRARSTGRRAGRRDGRGTALLLVITSIAVVTALTVDLAYNTRVSAQLAANARDELQATCLARSAVNLSRLVLHFQHRLDQPGGLAGVTGGAVPGVSGLNLTLRLWELVPIHGETMGFLGGTPPSSTARDESFPAFGTFDGTFEARIEDEDRKINLRQFDAVRPFHWTQASRMVELFADPRWDFLFDRDDANGLRVGRKELLAAVKDWIDIDETGSAFTANPNAPFESSYGDENALYDRLQDRYKAKNAPFDSHDELYLVAGFSDAFMAAFGDKLTVYPDLSATINVNTDDPRELLLNAVAMGGGTLQPAMADPAFVDKLRMALALARPLPFMSVSPMQFAQVLQGLGVKVAPEYLNKSNAGVTGAYGEHSTTFRIRATGTAGAVKKSIEAVVIFDRRALGLENDLGRLIHWHEE